MYKLEFTLKQHTPLIHFQHDQDGATLRATEVKPKLDRFLLSQYKSYLPESIILEKNGDYYLNYKLKVICEGNRKIYATLPLSAGTRGVKASLILSNMGHSDEKKMVFNSSPIRVIFFSMDEKFNDLLKQVFHEFLIGNNFGERQTKGFGSFGLDINDKNYFDPMELEPDYYFDIDLLSENSEETRFHELFESISLFSKAIRSGIHLGTGRPFRTTFYFKSLMYLFAKSKGCQWEKKTIKQDLLHLDEEESHTANFVNKQYLFKDTLGLSSREEWKTVKIKNGTISEIIAKENHNIERFKSPYLLKPMLLNQDERKWRIFLFYSPIPMEIQEQEFLFKAQKLNSEIYLKFPGNSIFSIAQYFKFLFRKDASGTYKVLLRDHVSPRYHNSYVFQKIEGIFNQIRKNANK